MNLKVVDFIGYIQTKLKRTDLKRKGRVILVGDIHGCHDEFMALLDKCEFIPGKDNLILLGDLVNKGPKSCEVGHRLACTDLAGVPHA